MVQSLSRHRYSCKYLFLTAYVLLSALWIKTFFSAAQDAWHGRNVVGAEFIIDVAVASLLAVGVFYSCRKFRTYMSDREEEYTRLFRKNPHPMWLYDLNTLRFLTVNDAACALYGYSRDEFLSMTIRDIRERDDVPALIALTDKIKLNFNHEYHWSGVWRHKLKGGELRYVEISSHEVIHGGKKAELVLAYDVTEKVLQDHKLQALNQELEIKVMNRTDDLLQLNKRLIDQNRIIKSANLELYALSNDLQEASRKIQEHADMKNKFVAIASHEFRTPLANISYAAENIKKHFRKLSAEQIIMKVNAIETQVGHLVCVLDDVLTIGKDDSTKLKVKIKPINVEQFVAKLVQEVQTAAGNTHAIIVNMDEGIPPVICSDENFLRNIFINLLSNAIKYSPGAAQVYLNVYPRKNTIYFEVRDNGLGIDQADIEKIFEPFFRSDKTQNISGTGLGLSIVKRAADLLNAAVSVTSQRGEGSTFRVLLPVS